MTPSLPPLRLWTGTTIAFTRHLGGGTADRVWYSADPADASLPPGRYGATIRGPGAAGTILLHAQVVDPTTPVEPFPFSEGREGVLDTMFILPEGADHVQISVPERASAEMAQLAVHLRGMSRPEYYSRLAATYLQRLGLGRSVRKVLSLVPQLFQPGGGAAVAARLRHDESLSFPNKYRAWIDVVEAASISAVTRGLGGVVANPDRPLIAVILPVFNTPDFLLRDAIGSILAQTYDRWELCIYDDGSTRPHIRELLAHYAAQDPRIRIVHGERNQGISQASNAALSATSAEWVAMFDHDDLLAPHALGLVAEEILSNPDAQVIYSDEDKIDHFGNRFDPYFKPDFSREFFRSQNYLNHLIVHRAANIHAVGGWRSEFDGSQDYDLNLRIIERLRPAHIRHLPHILYHWRVARGSTAGDVHAKPYAVEAGRRALVQHLSRTGFAGTVERTPLTPHYRIRPALPDPAPHVTIIIPTRDHPALLERCIRSITSLTAYPSYDILIVDNGSTDPAALAHLDTLRARPDVGVLLDPRPFNFSAINNLAVRAARGSILALVNDDIEVISPGWLREMASWAAHREIGCVGAKLYYPDDTIQHAGVILGIGGVAGHSHKRYPRGHRGYFCRLMELQNVSAVTAACLVVRKSVYEEVGGFDEDHLAVAFNDVDFCLRVGAAGYSCVWTPHAELYHHESSSRGTEDSPEKQQRFAAEADYMRSRWPLAADPYYSIHLTRVREDFSIALGAPE